MGWGGSEVTIRGYLGADPNLVNLPSGSQIAECRVAITRKWAGKNGQPGGEKTSWIDVKVLGRSAGPFAQYHRSGDPVLFPGGELEQETWPDKTTGQQRSKLVVRAFKFQFVPGKKDHGQQQQQQPPPPQGHGYGHGPPPQQQYQQPQQQYQQPQQQYQQQPQQYQQQPQQQQQQPPPGSGWGAPPPGQRVTY